MPLCDEVLAWVTLARAPALDAPGVFAALGILGSASAIMAASDALRARAGIPAAAREYLHRSGSFPSAAERSWLAGARHHLVPFTDPSYPKLLR
jgi:hypothetical protein